MKFFGVKLGFNSERGFTLVELLTVVGILGILSVALLLTLDPINQLKKGWDTQRKSDLNQIQKALETYYQDHGRYPNSDSSYRIVGSDGVSISWGGTWSPYMSIVPKDRSPSKTYVYKANSDGQSYWLYASLDRGGKDAQACAGGAACPNAPSDATCGDVCDFGVSSPNTTP